MNKLILCATAVIAALLSCKKESTPEGPGKKTTSGASPVVARYSGKEITLAELDKEIATQLYELRSEALEKMITKEVVRAEAKKQGKDEKALLRSVAEKEAGKPTEAEVRKFYDDNKERMEGQPFETLKGLIEMQLGRRKQQEAVGRYIDGLKKAVGVKITLPIPRVEVPAVGPAKGPANAPVTIVEFSDFECPFCSRGKETVEKVLSAYPGKIRLVFRDYPLPFHSKAKKAAEAALCADEQGKFWEMHDRLFSDQSKLGVDDLKASAKALSLDTAKFDSCLDSGKLASKVDENMSAGEKAGVNGTPAFFINGRLLSGAQPLEKFKEVIDEELAKK
jgi:protein-disulfide isomerase